MSKKKIEGISDNYDEIPINNDFDVKITDIIKNNQKIKKDDKN